jgi:Glycosyltransferase family 87
VTVAVSRLRTAGTVALVLLGGAACAVLAHDAVRAPGVVYRATPLLRDIAAWTAVAVATALVARRLPRRAVVAVVLLLAVAIRVSALAEKAPISDDLYRYAWDGHVQAAGVDPYRYPPADPALTPLRAGQWYWPADATCRQLQGHPGCTLINRAGAPTIYPPAAELWFLALDASGLPRLQDRGLELAGLGVDLAILAVLLSLWRRGRLDQGAPVLWALAPLAPLEIVADAHVDGVALLVTLAGLLAARRGRTTSAAVLLGVATLVKLYPALLLVAVLPRRLRPAAGAVAAFAGVLVVGYLPHVLAVGTRVVGYLPTYLREENYATGSRYLLVGLLGLTGGAATALVALVLGATALAVWWRRPDPLVGATVLYGTLLLLTTPVQPWYAVALAGVAVACGRAEWLAVGLAAYPVYARTVHDQSAVATGRVSYGLALLVVLAAAAWRWWRSRAAAPTGQAPRSGSLANARTPASNPTAAR